MMTVIVRHIVWILWGDCCPANGAPLALAALRVEKFITSGGIPRDAVGT